MRPTLPNGASLDEGWWRWFGGPGFAAAIQDQLPRLRLEEADRTVEAGMGSWMSAIVSHYGVGQLEVAGCANRTAATARWCFSPSRPPWPPGEPARAGRERDHRFGRSAATASTALSPPGPPACSP